MGHRRRDQVLMLKIKESRVTLGRVRGLVTVGSPRGSLEERERTSPGVPGLDGSRRHCQARAQRRNWESLSAKAVLDPPAEGPSPPSPPPCESDARQSSLGHN